MHKNIYLNFNLINFIAMIHIYSNKLATNKVNFFKGYKIFYF